MKKRAEVKIICNRFPALTEELVAAASKVVSRTAISIEQDVKGGGPHKAPYRTGNLRRSYIHRRESPLAYVIENDTDIAPYGIYVEFGTCKMAARPHLGPAAEAARQGFVDAMNKALGQLR